MGECGYEFTAGTSEPDDFDVDLYQTDSMRELAEYFVDEGLMGEIPENLLRYFDYDALVRELAVEYTEISLAGERYVYRAD